MMRFRWLTAAVIATLLSAPAWAGDNDRRGHRLDYIFTQLELTEEQRTQVLDVMKSVRQEHRSQMQARRQSGEGRPSREEWMALREQHRTELAERLNTVLTDEQVTELTNYLDAHRHHRSDRHKRGHHGTKAHSKDSMTEDADTE